MKNGKVIKSGGAELLAGEDIEQHKLCYINTTTTPDQIDKTTAKTDAAVGVVTDEFDTGETPSLDLTGPTVCIASAEINVGDKLMPAAAGKVAVADGTASSVNIGVALTYASGDGSQLEVELAPVKDVQ